MKLNIFNKGLNLRPAAHLIDKAESRVYENVKHSTGILEPIADKTDTSESSVLRYGYQDASTWYWTAAQYYYAKLNNTLCYAIPGGTAKKVYSGVHYDLGIPVPPSVVTKTLFGSPVTPITSLTLVGTIDGATDLDLSIAQQYKAVVAYTGNNSTYSQVFTYTATSGTGYITFSGYTIPGGATIKFYRLYEGVWKQASTGGIDGTNDISGAASPIEQQIGSPDGIYSYAITYESKTGTEGDPVLVSDEITADNQGISLASLPTSVDTQLQWKNLYRIGGTLTDYQFVAQLGLATTAFTDTISDLGLFLAGAARTMLIDQTIPSSLSYMVEYKSVLLGASGTKVYVTKLGEPEAWPTTNYLEFEKTVTGLIEVAIGFLVMSADTTWLITGNSMATFSAKEISTDFGCLSFDSLQLLEQKAIWASKDGLCVSSGNYVKLLTKEKLDLIEFTAINSAVTSSTYLLQLNTNKTLILDFTDGIIKYADYGIDSLVVDSGGVVYGHSSALLYSLETAGTDLIFSYTSPQFAAGGFVNKAYDKLRFYSEGAITVAMYIDNTLVSTKVVTTTDLHELKVPNTSTRGYYWHFTVTGTGKLYELTLDEGSANV